MSSPTVEALVRELATIGDVRISSGEKWFVSIFPDHAAPLWWYSSKGTLEESLVECREKAVRLRFLQPPNT